MTFLNLKNFNFSIVEQISDFLSGCSQLRNINLLNSIIGDNNLISSMIDNSLKNPTICTNVIILNKIISRYECPLIEYSNWREEEIQMENIKNKFMGNCILSQDEEESCYELCSYKVYYDEINNQYKCTKNNKCPETHQKLI